MSFTEDELQSFNTILEQRLRAHQRDMERALEKNISMSIVVSLISGLELCMQMYDV